MAEQKSGTSSAGGNKKARAPSQACPNNFWVELEHSTEFLEDRGQVEKAAGTPYVLTLGDGSRVKGTLDPKGQARITNLPAGEVQVQYEPDIDQQVQQLKTQLQHGLDEIIAIERAEYKQKEKELQEARVLGSKELGRFIKYAGATLTGLGNGAAGLLEFVVDAVKGCGKALYELSLRTNPLTAPQKFAEDLKTLKATYKELKDFVDEDLEAYATLMSDPEVLRIFVNFGSQYLAAQHSLEMTEGVGELAFDVALTIVTGGTGMAANARHVGQLKKLKPLVDKLVDALKRKKRRKHPPQKKQPNRKIVTKVQPRNVPCFCPFGKKGFDQMSPKEKKDYLQEYDRQLRRQEEAINRMRVDDYLTARETFEKYDRNPAAAKLQSNVKAEYTKAIKESIMKSLAKQNPTMGAAEIKKQAGARAKAVMQDMAALHEPDMVAGGWSAAKPTGIGSSSVNSSIGPSWNQKGRLAAIDDEAKKAAAAGRGQENLKIKLAVCTGKRSCP